MSLLTRISASPMIVNYRKMVPYVRPYWVRAVMPIGSFDALCRVMIASKEAF